MTVEAWLATLATAAGLGWAGWMSVNMIGLKADMRLVLNRLKIRNGRA